VEAMIVMVEMSTRRGVIIFAVLVRKYVTVHNYCIYDKRSLKGKTFVDFIVLSLP